MLDRVERSCGSGWVKTKLPDEVDAPAPGAGVTCRYLFRVAKPVPGQGIFLPGLLAHMKLQVNGQTVADTLREAASTLPRSFNRIVLVEVPDSAWADGANVIELTASGTTFFSVSRLHLGPLPALRRLHHWKVLGVVIGPAIVASILGTLGLCMLLLWRRRREALFGYFAAGNLAWAAHTLWTVLPWSPLSGIHHTVWWTSLYTFFVVMLIVFCIRFADWRWPRLEHALLGVAGAAPLVLYGSAALGGLSFAAELWRLLLVGLVGMGALAVARAVLFRRSVNRSLILMAGCAAFTFGIHDWLTSVYRGGDNPIYLVPYAGLPFAVFVVHLLMDRFVQGAEQLERMNVVLGQRVASQNAELQQTMEQMRQARDAAQAADQAKTRFLAAASHDLRQPAHALALYMAALRTEQLRPNQAELVQRMSGSLAALEAMFNMLLDISRIDAGALIPATKPFALEPVLRQLADEFAPQAEARGLRLSVRLPKDTSAHVHSDPMLVARILRNLLTNAIKYTGSGGILLACRMRTASQRAGQQRPQWRVEVWDTGVGISLANQTRIFDEFFQVDGSGRDHAKGLGLGLSIVRRLADLLDHPLEMGSREGRGSCFALRLPSASGRAQGTAVPASTDVTPIQGMKIGVIEDDVEVRHAMRELLGRWGCQVFEGSDAQSLLACLLQEDHQAQLDALLIDYRLAEGKIGPQEAKAFSDRWRSMRTLIITGESELEAVTASGIEWLAKPVSPALLWHWLASLRVESPLTRSQHGAP